MEVNGGQWRSMVGQFRFVHNNQIATAASKTVKAPAACAVRERPAEEENSISNTDPTQPAFRTAASHQLDEVLEVLEVL